MMEESSDGDVSKDFRLDLTDLDKRGMKIPFGTPTFLVTVARAPTSFNTISLIAVRMQNVHPRRSHVYGFGVRTNLLQPRMLDSALWKLKWQSVYFPVGKDTLLPFFTSLNLLSSAHNRAAHYIPPRKLACSKHGRTQPCRQRYRCHSTCQIMFEDLEEVPGPI